MSLPRSTPTEQGVDSRGLHALLDAAERDDLGLHSLMVVRHGHVVAEGWWAPYAADRLHLAYSLSKTLTATAIGFLVAEGRLAVSDLVLDLLPDVDRSAVAPGWEAVRVEHCLSMTVGHDVDAWGEVHDRSSGGASAGTDWLPRVLATEPVHEPGSHFVYNQVATYLLGLVVREVTGEGVAEVLRPRLLAPLGLPDVPWQRDPLGRELGFTGAHLTTEAIASVAQLHLDGGRWQGEQVLPEAWVVEATRRYGPLNSEPGSGPDWRRGYGYSFWQQLHGYRGDGAFGQYLAVLPEHDTVVAITGENERMQATLDALWEHLVPAIDRPVDRAADPAADPAADASLAERLAALAIPALSGGTGPADPLEARVTGGDLPSSWSWVRVSPDDDGSRLALRRDDDWLELPVGDGHWAEGTLVASGLRLPVVASGGWEDEATYRARVLVVETPHRFEVVVRRDATTTADLRWHLAPLNGPDPFSSAVHPA